MLACAAAEMLALGMCLPKPPNSTITDVSAYCQQFYHGGLSTTTPGAPGSGAAVPAAAAFQHPTTYDLHSPGKVTYKYPDDTFMSMFSLAHMCASGPSEKLQWDPTTKLLKFAPQVPCADATRSFTKQFSEFRISDFKTKADLCQRFFRTKCLFPEAALIDIAAFFARWTPLFEAVMDIYDLDGDAKKMHNDTVWRQMDDDFRKVIEEQRKFSHAEHAGDSDIFSWATMLVVA